MTDRRSYQTLEFWLNVVSTILVILMASGVIPTDSSVNKIIPMILTTLTAMGYTGFRTFQKNSDNKAKILGGGTGGTGLGNP